MLCGQCQVFLIYFYSTNYVYIHYNHCRLRYDENTKEYYNASGVEVRVPGFGGTDTIEYLDKSYISSYFNTFVKYFERMGYKKGKDLNGAPYDWRFAPGKI